MALITKMLNGIVTFNPDGTPALRNLRAQNVIGTDGTSVQEHMNDATLHASVTDLESTMDSKIAAAVGGLKDGADGSSLDEKYNTLKKIGEAVDSVNTALDTFFNDETGGTDGVIDTLKELIASIADNKDSIDALVSDKVAKSDIVNDLVTDDATKVLSAAQGVAIKALIDALDAEVTDAIAALHTHDNLATLDGIGVSASTGGLTYDGQDYGLAWSMEITESQAAALTTRPVNLHPNGMLFIVADPTPAP